MSEDLMVPTSPVKSIWTHGANSEPTTCLRTMVPTSEISLIWGQQRAGSGSSLISDHTFGVLFLLQALWVCIKGKRKPNVCML
jgi:hypothetical protein